MVPHLHSPQFAPELARELACPGCGWPMHTHSYTRPSNVIIDICPACRLTWLDHLEVCAVREAPNQNLR
jgi:Zn-finger nucleic acid-binding protein